MTDSQNFSVGTAKAEAGKWTTGTLTLGHFPDGPITTPVNIACGGKPGPVLWVQSAIHGTEIGGALGILKLFKELDLSQMSGAIVGIMAANPGAFRGYTRNTPLDGENMNRLFPGDPDGPHSRQSANVLFQTAMEVADAVIDTHSGGDGAVVPFYGLYWDDGSPASKTSAKLARAVGSPVVWRSGDDWLKGAMFVNVTLRGKPAVIVECGGGGAMPEEHIDNFRGAVKGVAQTLGILPGEAPTFPKYTEVTECELVFNRQGGYFLPKAEVGDIVEKGTVIAEIMDVYGNIVEEIRSPNGPAYLAALIRPYYPVYSGSMCAECNLVVSR
ncbi:M14 family metallopeptidase [Oceanibacterium hippocampi]|uniref:Succinylglutamate desuccinylase / Aspartoacylase family protein n=1 Tax=Oceanibacterium hippocampi TaxID=745714 RepID=A0A1Y5TNR5_9PROT|nr:M14 family metallopeptidase [Oceanibacterium hippocampi]SLN64691.1 Succinylglutamate desuccinylase / Aspartoacylase family protein [Oceanibacterium hippocampi]